MNVKALIAEFIGTFALIFVGVGAIAADYLSGGQSGLNGFNDRFQRYAFFFANGARGRGNVISSHR